MQLLWGYAGELVAYPYLYCTRLDSLNSEPTSSDYVFCPSESTHESFIPSLQELQKRREEELTGLQEQLADLTSKLEMLELNMKKYTASMGQMTELQTQGAAKNKEEEEVYKVKKKTFDLLPNADENIAKLKVSH